MVKTSSKRVNFINIQNGHVLSCVGYTAPVVRTGYEQVISSRTTETFATVAKESGKVISVKKDGIIVEYASGKRVGVNLGRIYGKDANLSFPFYIRTDLKQGQAFNKGRVIAYNEQFFEPDFLNPEGVVLKMNMPVMVALMESASTYEDSSAISLRTGKALTSKITTRIDVVANSQQVIQEVAKVGNQIKANDHLCVLIDETLGDSSLFDESTLASLRQLGRQTPRATVNGVVERIEVIYNDDLNNLSTSLREMAETSDRELAARRKAANQSVITGRTPAVYMVGKNKLLEGSVLITFYITSDVESGIGDKFVFGNQLKTIVGEVMDEPMVTEHGVEIDAKFGSSSVGSRIVHSPYLIGTASILSRLIAKRAIDVYRGSL